MKKSTGQKASRTVRSLPRPAVSAKKAGRVRGGRAGGDKNKYMEIKLKEVIVSGV